MRKILKIAAFMVLLLSFSGYAESEIIPIEEPIQIVEEQNVAPEVKVNFCFSWSGDEVHYGDEIRLVPEISGVDDLNYWYEWQYSTDNSNWHTWPTNSYTISEENQNWYWRLVVTYEWEDAE